MPRNARQVKHVIRLLKGAAERQRPIEWVLLENVEALLDRQKSPPKLKRGNGTVGSDAGDPAASRASPPQLGAPPVAWLASQFEGMGYTSWAHRVVNAAAFGLPHRRRRVFFLASLHGDARDALLSQGAARCRGACVALHGSPCFRCARFARGGKLPAAGKGGLGGRD